MMQAPTIGLRGCVSRAFVAFPILLAVSAAGCKPGAEAGTDSSAAKRAEERVSVTIDSVNYMHEKSTKYTLYDLSRTPPAAVGGAIVDRLGTGGEKGCCLALPKVWRPGMKLRLDWHESDRDNIYEERTQEMEIPSYNEPAGLYVVFYPSHQVELVVSSAEPGHPDWRGRIKKTPWEQCVETYGRKPCKAALPKQFDTNSKGFCTYMFQEKRADAEALCGTAMHQCMVDFEDEPFCKSVLWGPYKR